MEPTRTPPLTAESRVEGRAEPGGITADNNGGAAVGRSPEVGAYLRDVSDLNLLRGSTPGGNDTAQGSCIPFGADGTRPRTGRLSAAGGG